MMSTSVMCVLSALLVTMVTCSDDEKPAANYMEGDMDGKWYVVGVATHSWAAFTRTELTTVVVTSTPSTLNATFRVPYLPTSRWYIHIGSGTHPKGIRPCRSNSQVFIKDDTTAGLFTYHNHNQNFEVVVKQYEPALGYAVIHTAVDDTADDDCINELYSRTPDVSDAVKDAFVAHALEDDLIPNDKVTFLDNKGTC